MDEKKDVRYDLGGYSELTNAIRDIVNSYPGLAEGERIAFATLDEFTGLALYPAAQGIIERERRSVTGKVTQTCLYPFIVYSRAAGLNEGSKAHAKEWLDGLARWLEMLREFPTLVGNRRMQEFVIQTPGYLYAVDENHVETWAVEMAARYEYIYQK